MSQWTHIAAIIRVDGDGFLFGMSPQDEKKALEAILGNTANFNSSMEEWERCNVPYGSEGSLQYDVQITSPSTHTYRGHIAIWGDLRDYSDVNEIVTWFNGILQQFDDPNKSRFITRDAVMTIDVEFSGKRIIYAWNDKELVRKLIKVAK